MFGIIKIALLLSLLGFGFFGYDYFSHLSAQEKEATKAGFIEVLNKGNFGAFFSSLGSTMSDDFDQRFWPKVKKALHVLQSDHEGSKP